MNNKAQKEAVKRAVERQKQNVSLNLATASYNDLEAEYKILGEAGNKGAAKVLTAMSKHKKFVA